MTVVLSPRRKLDRGFQVAPLREPIARLIEDDVEAIAVATTLAATLAEGADEERGRHERASAAGTLRDKSFGHPRLRTLHPGTRERWPAGIAS